MESEYFCYWKLLKDKHFQENNDFCIPHELFCVFPENFNLAGNGSVPLRSMGIQSQSLYRGPLHCISTVLQNEGIQGLYRGAGAMILRDVPGYTLYFIPYTLFCNWLNPDVNAAPHPCCIWLAGGLAGKWDTDSFPNLSSCCLLATQPSN